ncbi:DsbA family protein [Patescibacteria group bacterium]|nr:DsbA family protein [Patescibacteria group bacterium]MBU1953169.1 DsbA family protein [Patescibacteria group bacterium]
MEKHSSSKKISSILNNQIVQIALVIVLVVAAFVIGSLLTKVQMLEKNVGKSAQGTETTTGANQQPQQPKIELAQIKDAINKAAIKFGDANGKLVILEVSDPSCPYCQIAGGKNKELNTGQFKLVEDGGTYLAPVPEIRKLVDQGKASFALIYFPGHGSGEMGMKALYCAFEMRKFWEVNDLIMSNTGYNLMNNTVKNDKTQSGVLADFLGSVINASNMKSCLDSGKYDSQLTADMGLASSVGVNGTPGFYINTTNFAGAYGYDAMEPVINAALGIK